jgi:1,4-dihydroxy-2-naphthoate octaprenyltransferase
MLAGLFALQYATAGADDIGGYRDGSDAINYRGRPAFTVAKKPLLTGALTEREAIVFVATCFAVGVASAPLAFWLLDGDVPVGALVVFAVAVASCLHYSTGLRISYRPLGLETQVFLTTGVLVLLPYWAVAGRLSKTGVLVSAVFGVWFLLVVAHGNASDRRGDADVGRRTLAVLLPASAFRLVLVTLFLTSLAILVAIFTTTGLRPLLFAAVVPLVAVHATQMYAGAVRQDWRRARFLGLVSLDVGCIGLAVALALS